MVTTQDKGPEVTTARKATETAKRVRGMVKAMYRAALEAQAEGRPRAYAFVVGLFDEVLIAMGITPIWIENYAGLCAAKRDTERFISKSDHEGFAGALCTYCTMNIGFDALRADTGEIPPNAPDGGMATPTMMISTGSTGCDPRHKLFQTLRRYHHDVPVYTQNLILPANSANIKEVQGYYVKYIVDELKGLVEFLEKQTGWKMDWDKLNGIIDIANETYRLRHEIDVIREAIPSPMPMQDAMNTMVPGIFLLGSQEALDFYRDLYAEVKYRADNKIGVIPDEKYRILWGQGLPPWHTMRIFNYFESLGAVIVAESAYRAADIVEIPKGVTHPLERLAWRYFKQMTYRHEKAQKHSGDPAVELMLEQINDYKIDGVIMHRVFSCRTAHVGEIHQLRLLGQYVDLPQMILEGDIVDPNLFPEAEAHTKIDAFIELVDAYKKRR